MRIKAIVLGAVMIAALCAGFWLFVSPSLNRQADLEQQDELLESILAIMPATVVVGSEVEIPVCDFESAILSDATSTTEQIIDEPIITDEPNEPEMPSVNNQVFEPLNQADFPSGIIPIGILTIDSIDLRLPVMEGVDEHGLRIAPGRVPQTAAVGEIGNAVIAGHRNYTYGSMFNRLGEVEIGDIIGFRAMSGEAMAFEVFEILVVTPDNQIAFVQPKNDTIITLYTCTPVRVATHRLLIRARIIEGGI
jgi:LPXTG-site transpeptidase (sortase) family protein